jgi:hypothetical protein
VDIATSPQCWEAAAGGDGSKYKWRKSVACSVQSIGYCSLVTFVQDVSYSYVILLPRTQTRTVTVVASPGPAQDEPTFLRPVAGVVPVS